LKRLYRVGLSHRYDSLMQAIAGLPYNFSMPDTFWAPYQRLAGFRGSPPDFRTESYLHLIPNFHRHSCNRRLTTSVFLSRRRVTDTSSSIWAATLSIG